MTSWFPRPQRPHRPTLLALAALALAAAAPPPGAPSAPTPSGTAAATAPAGPALSPADRAGIARIEAYLNSLHTLKAHFLQVAPSGAISEGTAWLARPGRMRFQYAAPSPLLLVAGHGVVLFHDASLHQTSTIPLDRTPLGILLAPEIHLGGPVAVTALRRLPGEIALTLVRRATPAEGSLTLVFTTDPLALRQWTVTDAQHQRTTVTLENIETGGSFAPDRFAFPSPDFVGQQGAGG